MDIVFWLSKVYVVLLFCRISSAHYDDLLERIRLSKSNDPEVREFLKNVLHHHADFRWIQGEASKRNLDDQILPLRGLPLKNKRSFYSSRNGYTSYSPYGYRMSESNYDHPINDVYPYGEEEYNYGHNNVGERTYRETDYNVPTYQDFLEESGEPKSDIASFVSDNDSPLFDHRDPNSAKLLQQKLMLRNILFNKNLNNLPEGYNDETKMSPHFQDSIEVQPNSEKGVLYAPGNKFEFKSDDNKKRCITDSSDQEIRIDDIEKKSNMTIEQPLGEFYYSNPHDVLGMNQDVLMEQHLNNTNCRKFKKNSRKRRGIRFDDLLKNQQKRNKKPDKIKIKIFDDSRLVKDIQKDTHGNAIVLTIKNNDHFPLSSLGSSSEKDYDKYSPSITNLLYNKDDTLQKIDSIIKHDEATLKLNAQLAAEKAQRKSLASVEPLLHVGDAELFHIYEESPAKNGTTRKRNPIDYSVKKKSVQPVHNIRQSKDPVQELNEKSGSYERINEIGTRINAETSSSQPNDLLNKIYENPDNSGFVDNSEHLEISNIPKETPTNKRWSGFKKKNAKPNSDGTTDDSQTTVYMQDQVNRLEDQTEPTSAAEQRELGKINNNFNTDSMDSATTERILIIPFKKSAYPIDDNDFDAEGYDKKFHVKDSRDMIHVKKTKRKEESDGNALSENSLKDAEEVMNKLKIDLEKTIKRNNDKNNAKLVSYNGNELIEPKVSNNLQENYNEEYSDDDGSDGNLNSLSDKAKNKIETEQRFQFRNLKFIDESTPKLIRVKRGLPDMFGMTNDEDYSEDKIDYYEADNKHKESSNVNSDDINIVRNHKNAKKSIISRNKKGAKMKTIIKYKRFEEAKKGVTNKLNKKFNKNILKDDIESKVNLFTNNVDVLKKRESHLPDYLVNKKEENKEARTLDDDESDSFNVEDKQDEKTQQANNGNELDIIEKTQAIILHVTNPPNGAGCSAKGVSPASMKGGVDDNDDPASKLNGRSQNSDSVNVNHVNTYKMGEHTQKDEDVMEQILKLVNQFKQAEKRKQSGEKAKKEDLHLHRYLAPYEDDDEEDLASFAHHFHKDKKAHPSNINMKNCNIKPGVDHIYKGYHPKHIEQDLQFSIPQVTREGQVPVETIADKDEISENNVAKHVMHSDGENPMEYLPDQLEGFKSIVETGDRPERNAIKSLLNNDDRNDDDNLREKRDINKNGYLLELREGIKRHKREVQSSADDLEFDALLSPLQRKLTRHKNYYYHPYLYETFPHHRQAPNPPPDALSYTKGGVTELSTSTSTSVSSTGTTILSGSTTLSSTEASTVAVAGCEVTRKHPSCMGEEEAKILNAQCLQDEEETTKKNKTHKHKSHKLLEDNGDMIYDSRMQHNEKSDHYLQSKNRAKLKQDMAENTIKEHEKMRNVLNGHVILKIMDKFVARLKENENLYKRFGTAIAQKCAAEQVGYIDEFREEQSKKDIKHAQLMLHQVIMMINQIVADQVHRKTCLPLTPTLKHFLMRMVTVKTVAKSKHVAEGYPLPQIKGKEGNQEGLRPEEKQGDFLFEKSSDVEPAHYKPDITMAKKIALIKKLLHKYNHMSENCQITVEPVKDYLVQHLAMLEKLRSEKKLFHDEVCAIPEDQKCKANTTTNSTTTPSQTENGTTTTISGQSTTLSSTTISSTELTTETSTTLSTSTVTQAAVNPPSASSMLAAPVHSARSPFKSFYNPGLYNYMTNNVKYGQRSKLSAKYQKLVQAADKYRRKRQIEQRLARLFGRHKKRDDDDTNKSDDNDNADDIGKIAFESPVVYSLDE